MVVAAAAATGALVVLVVSLVLEDVDGSDDMVYVWNAVDFMCGCVACCGPCWLVNRDVNSMRV